jgi:transcriptional regulator with XRE-family HTH domain
VARTEEHLLERTTTPVGAERPDGVDVGTRLRQVRTARRRTLKDVAADAGITESFLSQVERARANASIATLRRVAGALGVTIGDLFDQQPDDGPQILRADSRPALDFGLMGRKYHLNGAPHRAFDLLICEFEPGGSTGDEPYTHGDSEEIALVLDGSIEFHLGGDHMRLRRDDSVRYRSSTPHRIVADGAAGARVLFAATPPTF